jgi:hypothetical protein
MALYISPVDGVQHTEDPSTAATLPGKALGAPSPATSATTGYVYIPVMAGVPTGVPTAATGYAPLVLDSTTGQLWAYMNGSWQGVIRRLTANDANPALTLVQNGAGGGFTVSSFTIDKYGNVLSGGNISAANLNANGQLNIIMGGAGQFCSGIGVANIQYAPVGNTAGVLTTLFTYAFPANGLDVAGKAIRIKSCGTLAANANSKTIVAYFGSTQMAIYTGTASGLAYRVEATVIKTGASAQTWSATLSISGLAPLEFNGTSTEVDTAAIAVVTKGNGLGAGDVTGTSQETWYAS